MTKARIPAREWIAAHNRLDRAGRAELHNHVAAALRIPLDRISPVDAWYVFLPFVILATDDGMRLAGTTEPPLPLSDPPEFEEWFDHGDPTTGPTDPSRVITLAADGTANIHRERRANHLLLPERPPEEHMPIFTDGRAFFRAWVAARLRWLGESRSLRREIHADLPERTDGCLPGALLIGNPRKVHWPSDRVFIADDDATARAVNAGIRASARLAECRVGNNKLRRAA